MSAQADEIRQAVRRYAAEKLAPHAARWDREKEFPREASQALGQKNTAFTIYLALTYASPLVALGPSCYVIWHNLWNSWQLHRAGRLAR